MTHVWYPWTSPKCCCISLKSESLVFEAPKLRLSILDATQLQAWIGQSNYELSAETVATIDQTHVVCFGAFQADVLAGYIFCCDSPVAAKRNSGGAKFTGIGLEFAADIRYVYKVLVLPEFRGQQLAARLIGFAANYFRAQSVNNFVTTTDWTNTAFLRTAVKGGFISKGTAAEVLIFNKHRYLLPRPIPVDRTSGQCIRLVKPDSFKTDR